MIFKPEITLGQLVELIGLVSSLIYLARKFGAMEQKLTIMYDWWVHSVLRRQEIRQETRHENAKVERFVR